MTDWKKNNRPNYRTSRWQQAGDTQSAKKTYYDNADMMQMFNVTARTLQRWRQERLIPFKKLGGKIYYLSDEVDKLMRGGGALE